MDLDFIGLVPMLVDQHGPEVSVHLGHDPAILRQNGIGSNKCKRSFGNVHCSHTGVGRIQG